MIDPRIKKPSCLKPRLQEPSCVNTHPLTRSYYEATVHGDATAANRYCNEVVPRLTQLIAAGLDRWGLSQGFAEIAACEATIKALDNADKFDFGKEVWPWQMRIGCHQAVNCIRLANQMSRNQRSLDAPIDRFQDGGATSLALAIPNAKTLSSLDALVRREEEARQIKRREQLETAISELSREKQLVVDLRQQGLRNREIAVLLRMSSRRVAAIYFDSKQKLRTLLS